MEISRRRFLATGTATVGAAALLGACDDTEAPDNIPSASESAPEMDPSDWGSVAGQFQLDPSKAHLSAFVLAAHPQTVRAAIEKHREGLDLDTQSYLYENELQLEETVSERMASYLGVPAGEVALTDSTTMGLGLLYGGTQVEQGDELLTTTHDFYSTHEALELKAQQSGAAVRQFPLFDDPTSASVDEIVAAVDGAIEPETRVLAITWVHSSTGLRLPVPAIAQVVADANRNRDEHERVLLCVDGVHGFGSQDVDAGELGCDFWSRVVISGSSAPAEPASCGVARALGSG